MNRRFLEHAVHIFHRSLFCRMHYLGFYFGIQKLMSRPNALLPKPIINRAFGIAKSIFFQKLIYIDPHVAQKYSPLLDFDDEEDKFREQLSLFHCESLSKMDMEKMNPSCCVGFLFRKKQELDSVVKYLNLVRHISEFVRIYIFKYMAGKSFRVMLLERSCFGRNFKHDLIYYIID